MSEMAEGARLEIVCAVKSGTEGSNPSLSAIPVRGSGFMGSGLLPGFWLLAACFWIGLGCLRLELGPNIACRRLVACH